eukprot:scaffold36249_cov36-Cyclotella_meneghiniana.AAC.3
MSPTDVSYMVWSARGNQATCTIYGFVVIMGMNLTLYYSCSLNIYYLILIKYNKSGAYIRKKVEPFLHGIPFSLGLIWSIVALVNKNYNAGESGQCSTTPIYNPPHCQGYEDGEVREGFTIPCGRGRGEAFYLTFGGMCPKQEKRMARYGTGAINTTSKQSPSDQNIDRSYSRAVLNRAIAYSCSYFLTWGWVIGAGIMALLEVLAVKKSNETDNISWPRAFVKTFLSGLSSPDRSQNNRTRAAASNKKEKNAQPALAGSKNNKTSATSLSSSNSLLNTTGHIRQLSTPYQMSTGGISESQNI